jgi:hypothetical protein
MQTPRSNVIKRFYWRILQMFAISNIVCTWQAFLAKSNVCKEGWSLPEWVDLPGLTHKHLFRMEQHFLNFLGIYRDIESERT